MEPWTRARTLEWCRAHAHRTIRLRQRSTAARVEGRLGGVDQIDACATAYDEIVLDVGLSAMQVALSFHDERVLVHVMGFRPGTRRVWLSTTMQIPYDQVLLAEIGAGGDGEEDSEAEPAFHSPYELLS